MASEAKPEIAASREALLSQPAATSWFMLDAPVWLRAHASTPDTLHTGRIPIDDQAPATTHLSAVRAALAIPPPPTMAPTLRVGLPPRLYRRLCADADQREDVLQAADKQGEARRLATGARSCTSVDWEERWWSKKPGMYQLIQGRDGRARHYLCAWGELRGAPHPSRSAWSYTTRWSPTEAWLRAVGSRAGGSELLSLARLVAAVTMVEHAVRKKPGRKQMFFAEFVLPVAAPATAVSEDRASEPLTSPTPDDTAATIHTDPDAEWTPSNWTMARYELHNVACVATGVNLPAIVAGVARLEGAPAASPSRHTKRGFGWALARALWTGQSAESAWARFRRTWNTLVWQESRLESRVQNEACTVDPTLNLTTEVLNLWVTSCELDLRASGAGS